MTNHLIIGLGGTGGKIIRAFRKTLYQEFRNLEVDNLSIGYLYVDSDKSMMDLTDESWKILGQSVHLHEANQVYIGEANLKTMLSDVNRYPGIKNWIGEKETWNNILGGVVGEMKGGQKRRLGRFLLAANIEKFNNQLDSQISTIKKSGQTDVTFHICCGLAGGTGSGCVIDVITQIRKRYFPNPNTKYKIMLYTLLPERVPKPNWDTGNYHTNGYAALMELNALKVEAYKPYDISGEIAERLTVPDPFSGCYLFTNENENNITVDVVQEVPTIIADFLYQKIVAVRDITWNSLGRRETCENSDNEPEGTDPNGTGERARHFLSFGIKRLAIPEEEIKEYLIYNFAEQAGLQLRFNNWSEDGGGYLEESCNCNYNEFVKMGETLTRWKITDDHLILSKPITEDETTRRWRVIEDDWKNVISTFKDMTKTGESSDRWFDTLLQKSTERYESNYRNLGVSRFYNTKLRDRDALSKEIVNTISKELFDDWRQGVKCRSIYDIKHIIAALINSLEERMEEFETKTVNLKERAQDTEAKIDANKQTWSKIGFLSAKLLGRQEKTIDALGINLEAKYIYRTKIEGYAYGIKFIQTLVEELQKLNTDVSKVSDKLNKSLEKFDQSVNERCKETYSVGSIPHEAFTQQLVKYYDSEEVKSTVKKLISIEDVQKNQTSEVRRAIAANLGVEPTFKLFNERISKTRLLDILESSCGKFVAEREQDLHELVNNELLGVSLVKRLKERFDGDNHELMKFIKNLVDHSGNYVNFDDTEKGKTGVGTAGANQQINSLTVVLPDIEDEREFIGTIEDAFNRSRPSHVQELEPIYSRVRPYEIALISITNLFPLRYLSLVKFLKSKYDTRISGTTGDRTKIEVHTEGDGTNLPSLYVLTEAEQDALTKAMQESSVPYLLLAKATDLLTHIEEDASIGIKKYALIGKDEDGLDKEPIFFGESFSGSYLEMNEQKLSELQGEVVRKLDSDFKHIDAKKQLKAKVASIIEKIKTEKGGNLSDPVYKLFLKSAREVNKNYLAS